MGKEWIDTLCGLLIQQVSYIYIYHIVCMQILKKNTKGTMDITLWEEAGHDSRKLRVGQYVLLEQLATSDIQLSDLQKVWYVNGSVICGTKVYNSKVLNDR